MNNPNEVLVVWSQGHKFDFSLRDHFFDTNPDIVNRLTVWRVKSGGKVAGVEIPAGKERIAQFAGDYAFKIVPEVGTRYE